METQIGGENDAQKQIACEKSQHHTPKMEQPKQQPSKVPLRISEPMLPKTLCISLITNNLSDQERLSVLEVLLSKMKANNLVESCGLLFEKFAALKEMQDFIAEDFFKLMMQALEKLHEAKADNILYYLILWCLYGDFCNFEEETSIKEVIDGGKLFKEALQANEEESEGVGKGNITRDSELMSNERIDKEQEACNWKTVNKTSEKLNSNDFESVESSNANLVRRSLRQKKGLKRKLSVDSTPEDVSKGKERLDKVESEVMSMEDKCSNESSTSISHLIKVEVFDCDDEAKDIVDDDETEGVEAIERKTEPEKVDLMEEETLDDRDEDYSVENEEDQADSDYEFKLSKTKLFKSVVNIKKEPVKKEGLREYNCELCNEMFGKKGLLRDHMNKHKDETQWTKCPVCHRQFRDKEHLEEHSAKAHAPFLCELCGKALKSKKALELHEHVHFPDKRPTYECPDCDKILRSVNGMRDHRITVHVRGRAKPYLCSECGQKFTFEKNLRKHIQRHKEKVKPYECNECDKKFHTEEELSQHKDATHVEGEFRCRLCLRVYPTKARLRKHIQNIHTCPVTDPEKLKALTCDKCGRVYRRKWELDYHKKRVHVEKEDFKCEFCNKLFASESLLADHRAVHTREARFFCEVCGEGFVHRSSYKAHLFKHNEEKFDCPLCNKQFDVPFYLTRHIREVHKDHPMPVLPQFKYTGPVASAKQHREMAEKAKATGQILQGKEKAKYVVSDYSRKRKRRERMGPVKNVLLDKNKVTLDDVEELVIDDRELKSLGDTELAVSNLPQGDGSISVQTQEVSQFISIEQKLPANSKDTLPGQKKQLPQVNDIVISRGQPMEIYTEQQAVQHELVEIHGGELDVAQHQYVEEVHDQEEVYQEIIATEQVKVEHPPRHTKTIQLEIGGQTQVIEVPDDAEFIQVGDSILQLDQIL